MSLNDLRDEAVSNLNVTASIVSQNGGDIDIGEQFTARFTVRNQFHGGEGENRGHAHYNDVRLRVASTSLASVVGGDRTIDVTNHLGYGHSDTVDVTFLAEAKLANILWINPTESYAKVDVFADFDIPKFFNIVQSETFATQIDNG